MVEFVADFAADFLAGFPVHLLADFRQMFRRIVQRVFRRIFPWNLLGIGGGFLEKVPKPCKTKDLRDFLQKVPKKFPHKFSLVVVHCCSLGTQVWPGFRTPPPNPPECWGGWGACHHANAERHPGLLIHLSTFSSTYKVQQGNSKLLCVAKQHSLAFAIRLHFPSLRKEEHKEKSQKSITFSLCRFLGTTFWHYVCSGFSEIPSIFKKIPVFSKSRRATQKHKLAMGTAEELCFGHFFETSILRFVWAFQIWKRKSPVFPQFWAFLHSAEKCQPRTLKAESDLQSKNSVF